MRSSATSRGLMAPTVDPNDYARRLAAAKAKANEIKERNRNDFRENRQPTPPTGPSVSLGPGYQAAYPPSGYVSAAEPMSQPMNAPRMSTGYDGAAQPSYAAAPDTRPGYRGMVVYGDSSGPSAPYGGAAAPAAANSHYGGGGMGGYGAPQSVAPAPSAVPRDPMAAREAEDTFYNMLRSDDPRGGSSRAPAARGRRPEWNSDYASGGGGGGSGAAEAMPGSAAQQAGGGGVPSGPMSTAQKLAMMRGELKTVPAASDAAISKQYGGIIPQQQQQQAAAAAADEWGPLGGAPRQRGGAAPADAGGFGGGGGGGGGGGLGDVLAPKQQVVSRTGLKPAVKKAPQATAAARPPASYGNDDMPVGGGNAGGGYAPPAPASYGNDDMPVGRSAGGGLSGGRGPASPPLPAAHAAYGNDDMPVGKSAATPAAAAPAARRGGYAIDWDNLGPDSMPPGGSGGSSGGNGNGSGSSAPRGTGAAAVRARLAQAGYAAPPAAEEDESSSPDEYSYNRASGRAASAAAAPQSRSPGAVPPATSKLALLKSKLRTGSARTSRSGSVHGGESSTPVDNDGGAFASGSSEQFGGYGGYGGYSGGHSHTPAPAVAAARGPPARPATGGAASSRAAPASSSSYGYGGGEEEEYGVSVAPRRQPAPVAAPAPAAGPGPGEEEPPEDVELVECDGCGRKFNPTALEKHSRICKKVFQTKRQAFDTKAHLLPDELQKEKQQVLASAAPPKKGKKGAAAAAAAASAAAADRPIGGSGGSDASKTAWQSKSNALREAMAAARRYKAAVASGVDPADIPPVPASAPDPSLVQCPHCGRSFNEHAAERHIPKCTTIKAKPSMLKKGAGVAAGAAGVSGVTAVSGGARKPPAGPSAPAPAPAAYAPQMQGMSARSGGAPPARSSFAGSNALPEMPRLGGPGGGKAGGFGGGGGYADAGGYEQDYGQPRYSMGGTSRGAAVPTIRGGVRR